MESDEKANKSVLLPNLCILIKHFLLNINLLPHSWSVDVSRVLHQEKSGLRCQMPVQGHFCSDCSCSSRAPLPAWQMVQSWRTRVISQPGKHFFHPLLFPEGKRLKQWWGSGDFNWTSSLLEKSCISEREFKPKVLMIGCPWPHKPRKSLWKGQFT